ncbi:MAG: hypothetical protein WC934_13340 [Acidithiobacillus sp.]|jgi:hypothetical protein|uniref:hypothetical protein n=1 Tax=Acidithiobacillus sp. TaxID=1872118 RepID=UPI00355CB13B
MVKLDRPMIRVAPGEKRYEAEDHMILKGDGCRRIYERTLSNFVIRGGEKERNGWYKLRLENGMGEMAEVELCASQMAHVDEFQEVLLEKGFFVWHGSQADLLALWDQLHVEGVLTCE